MGLRRVLVVSDDGFKVSFEVWSRFTVDYESNFRKLQIRKLHQRAWVCVPGKMYLYGVLFWSPGQLEQPKTRQKTH